MLRAVASPDRNRLGGVCHVFGARIARMVLISAALTAPAVLDTTLKPGAGVTSTV